MPLQENIAQYGGILMVNDESERKNMFHFKKRL